MFGDSPAIEVKLCPPRLVCGWVTGRVLTRACQLQSQKKKTASRTCLRFICFSPTALKILVNMNIDLLFIADPTHHRGHSDWPCLGIVCIYYKVHIFFHRAGKDGGQHSTLSTSSSPKLANPYMVLGQTDHRTDPYACLQDQRTGFCSEPLANESVYHELNFADYSSNDGYLHPKRSECANGHLQGKIVYSAIYCSGVSRVIYFDFQ